MYDKAFKSNGNVNILFQQVPETYSMENCTGTEAKDLVTCFRRKKKVGNA